MINIIRKGQVPPKMKIIYKKICTNCGCEFEFDRVDLKYAFKEINGEYLGKIDCPTCNNEIGVSYMDMIRKEVIE